MKSIDVTELKKIQISILEEVHKFCENSGLKYFLAFGTLLGAVRHKGYIPWDDDIDLIMPRPDYERFVKEFKHPYLDVFHFYSKRQDLIPFCKVYDTRTTFIEESAINYLCLGVNIDIFPFDGVSSDINTAKKHIDRINVWNKISEYKKMTVKHKRNFYKNVILFCIQALLVFIPYEFVIKRICNLMKYYDYNESEYVTHLFEPNYKRIMSKTYYQDFVLMDFEGKKFYGLKHYHEYLSTYFGDYMQLPPVEKRISHHFFKAYWI